MYIIIGALDLDLFIFQVYKGFVQRCKTKREREEEFIFIGMVGVID
jgi:hypothetical protein